MYRVVNSHNRPDRRYIHKIERNRRFLTQDKTEVPQLIERTLNFGDILHRHRDIRASSQAKSNYYINIIQLQDAATSCAPRIAVRRRGPGTINHEYPDKITDLQRKHMLDYSLHAFHDNLKIAFPAMALCPPNWAFFRKTAISKLAERSSCVLEIHSLSLTLIIAHLVCTIAE
jgi:hypothetical protein